MSNIGALSNHTRACQRTLARVSPHRSGVGQTCDREFRRGVIWLMVTSGLWIWSGALLGWIRRDLRRQRAKRKNALV